MIGYPILKEIATKYKTTEQNVAREYCQHLFLSYLYKTDIPQVEQLLFKGGTALRIIYQSPRFSEDVDFSSFGLNKKNIEDIFINTLEEIEKEGIETELSEAKETTGGYLGKAFFEFLDFDIETMIQVQSKEEKIIKGEIKLIAGEFLPPYNLLMLPEEILVEEKITAAITRTKPRDFYDIYFILRKGLLKPKYRGMLESALDKLKESDINFAKELSIFLPKDQQQIVKEFRIVLESEIKKYV